MEQGRDNMGTCKLGGCEERARKRSRFWSPEHRDEYRRIANGERMRRNRAAGAALDSWQAYPARTGLLDNRLAKFCGNALTPPIQ
jgi:hypothetical protein